MGRLFAVLFVFLCFTFCNGAKILGVFNHPGKSHTFLGKVLLKNLAEKGHQVVMISSFPMEKPIPNYKDIPLPEHLEDLIKRNVKYEGKLSSLAELRNMSLKHTEDTFINLQVKELLQSKETFDVVIMDWFFNEGTLIFGHVFKAPVIYVGSFGNMALLNEFTGNTLPYSYVPGAGMFMSDNMSFKERVIMTLFNVVMQFLIPRRNKAHHEILKRHFHDPPTIEELQENVALVLANSHFSLETPRPYTPNIIPIAGFHIQETNELPKHLKNFLDSAEEGAIFFSLGSLIKSSNLNKTTISHLISAFGKLPQKILWKYEADDLTDLPTNVKISKWVPQTDVLAHPNIKLFISHCGSLSYIEAIYRNVPLLCVPFNGDQPTCAAFAVSRNIGLHVMPDNITEEIVISLVQELFKNPRYREQMNFHSTLLREQPIKPLELATFWIEHVIKHKRTDYLRTFATKLPWYKYYLIDVISFILAVTFIVVKITTFLIRWTYRKIASIIKTSKKSKIA